ncbi:MAG: GNAT family N-acetyltransferase [Verrucomicrobiae bacterium]|nr:GNAT family N-acetyltransferase [Verrucomicrobiae bacterium]
MPTFRLQEYRPEYLDRYFAAVDESRNHVGRWMDWLTPEFTKETAREWFATCDANRAAGVSQEFLLVDTDNDSVVGACGLNQCSEIYRMANLGYWVRASRLREGAASAGVTALRELGFNQLNLNRIEIVVAVGNTASQRVAKRAGAIEEGVLRARLIIGDIAHDAKMYSFINPAAHRAKGNHLA